MLKFSKIGITRRKAQTSTGYLISETWVWPWRRGSESKGHRYRVDVVAPNGWGTSEYFHFSGTGFNKLESAYSYVYHPMHLLSSPEISVMGFELDRLLEGFLANHLPHGEYLVYVPRGPSERKQFWDKQDLLEEVFHGRDGYILSVGEGHSKRLAKESAIVYPGRYFGAYSAKDCVVVEEFSV